MGTPTPYDETALIADAGAESVKQVAGSATTADGRDWTPPHGASDAGVHNVAATLAWFKANHAD